MTITITNGKGGTGKTTLNTVLAEWLYAQGKKVLLVDCDPNCSMSEIYDFVLQDKTTRHLLSGKETEPYIIRKAENGGELAIIPSDLDLDMLANITDTQLKIQLRKQNFVSRFDFILIDPPGTWGAQTRNAVFAADRIIIAGKCSPLDFAATSNYVAKLQDCGLDADVTVVCNGYNSLNDPDGIWPRYQAAFGEFLLSSPIPKMNSLKRIVENPGYRIRADLAERLLPFIHAASGEISSENQEVKK